MKSFIIACAESFSHTTLQNEIPQSLFGRIKKISMQQNSY